MTILLGKRHFQGVSKVHAVGTDGLTEIVRQMAIHQAQIILAGTADLTDNSGGAAANGTIEAVVTPTLAVLGSTDATQKAEFEAGALNVVDALKELIARMNTIVAKVPAFAALTDSLVGTAADGTIAVIDATYTGVAASMAKGLDVQTIIAELKSRVSQAAYHVNRVATACGQVPVIDSLGVTKVFSSTFAVTTATVSTASGADATSANAIIKVADAGVFMAALAAAIKELATKLNACTGTTPATVPVVCKASA